MLYPFTVMYAMKSKKMQDYFLVILQGIAMIMVGTKVAAFGCVLILLSALGIAVVFGFVLKQFSVCLRDFVVFCFITLGLTVLLFHSPIISMNIQRDEAYILDEEDLKLKEEIKETLRQDNEEISKNLETSFFNNQIGNTKNSKSKNDGLVITFCYIYDINFKVTYKIISENNYYNKIYERINRKDIFKPYIEHTNKYILERID